MHTLIKSTLLFLVVGLTSHMTWADEYDAAIKSFEEAGESGAYFETSYGYAVFPTIGKGGIGIGGAHGVLAFSQTRCLGRRPLVRPRDSVQNR